MEIIVTLWLSFNGLDSNKLFEISYDCAPENVRAGKSLGKILYKLLKLPFFQYIFHDQGKDMGNIKERRRLKRRGFAKF